MRVPRKEAHDDAVSRVLYALFNDTMKLLSAAAGTQRKAVRMDEIVKSHLLRVLEAFNQNQTHASKALGIDRRTLQRNLDDIQPHRKKRTPYPPLDVAHVLRLRDKGLSWQEIAKKLDYSVYALSARVRRSPQYADKVRARRALSRSRFASR